MERSWLRVALAGVAALALATGAYGHGCDPEDKYLIGHYHGACGNENELPEGQGEARGADTYVGMWHHGKPEGAGVYRWENGARLEGRFRDGKAEGEGFYVGPTGARYEGPFAVGKLVGAKKADCPSTPGPLTC
ncbi:MAG TPA: hypothetical protein VFE23_15425 [Usitatibacter sp.]|nr:hypothetical protein [Usitatibacter sp.]